MGPEQALMILFRDSNMNAVDIDEEEEKSAKLAATARDFMPTCDYVMKSLFQLAAGGRP